MVEIERKFLVRNQEYREEAATSFEMVQAFLSTDPDRTVRVRKIGEQGWITIKGRTGAGGTTREEWEYAIPGEEATGLLEICLPGAIHKTRFTVPFGSHVFEVDEFHGDNQGLILAEVELQAADESFQKPSWLGKEVTGSPEYYNSQLSIKPYTSWKDDG